MIHAYAATEPGGELKPFEYDPGDLGNDEIEIAVEHCGICHSDLSMLKIVIGYCWEGVGLIGQHSGDCTHHVWSPLTPLHPKRIMNVHETSSTIPFPPTAALIYQATTLISEHCTTIQSPS